MEREYLLDLDTYSAEMQDIIGRPPLMLERWYQFLVIVVILGAACGLLFFSCPDTITAPIEVVSTIPSANLYAKVSGSVRSIMVSNGQKVHKGTVIAEIDNRADYHHILLLKQQLEEWINGDISTKELQNAISQSKYQVGELVDDYSRYLQIMVGGAAVTNLEIRAATSSMLESIRSWMDKYLLLSPIEGIVQLINIVGVRQYVTAGTLLCYVTPDSQGAFVGKALIAANYRSKISQGQHCAINIIGFPSEDYGSLDGNVEHLYYSSMPEGRFLVDISLPANLVTNTGKIIPLEEHATGQVTIMVKDRRLWELIAKPLLSFVHN